MKSSILFLLLTASLFAQYSGRNWSIALNGVYTTSAKIYLNPNSSDPALRNNSFPVGGFLNPQVEIMYKIDENIMLGFSTEYMRATSSGTNLTAYSGNRTVSVLLEDGFLLIPFEFSGYYILPFSSERFTFLMGGGIGFYYGEHIRKFGDVKISNSVRPASYGIQVMLSMDYMFDSRFSVRGEMKFRDPQFRLTSIYDKTDVNYNGSMIHLPQQTFNSKINVDGICFILGLVFHL
jgi:hypothetical protein